MTPRPYQIEGRDFLAARRFALLADEMRVGKTPQAILAAAKINAQRTVVVCPAIAVPQWRREWARWEGTGDLMVVSYNRLGAALDAINGARVDVAIVDESHFAKNPDALRTKQVYGKGGLAWCAHRMWALSGTPATKHAAELWAMLRCFGAVRMSYDEFVREFCYVDSLTLKIIGTKPRMIPVLREMLAPVMLRRTRKQVAPEMPSIGYEFLHVAAGADLTRDVDIDSPEDMDESRKEVAISKVSSLAEHIDFALSNGLLKQTVVFGWHVDALEQLSTTLIARGHASVTLTGKTLPKQRERIQEDFRSGSLQIICANIMAAGTAIDLSAASHGYFIELDWVPGNNAQAANRLVAIGKDEPVTYDIATRAGSVDEAVHRVLLRRTKELSKLFA